MRVGLGWLAEWIDLPASRDELMATLTSAGLEIEDVIETGPQLEGVRVGHVVERGAHPDAEKLSLCRVDVGEDEPLEIVCGAPNVAAGQKVAVALHGTVLPGGLKIKRSKIRGVKSHGMICSAPELGLGDDATGILVLDAEAPIGAPLGEVLEAGETVLDMEITPNRGDWVSMHGMAREVRANFGGEVRLPACTPEEGTAETSAEVDVVIDDAEGCHRYVARIVRGLAIGPSPDWLVARLEAAGLRAVNNIVDVTNLVMLELGQPLHAFDLDRVHGTVHVRAAAAGEKIRTLDEQDRELAREDLLIADERGALAIAGVMGGAESEVRDGTTNVLLESAHFQPSRVRRTARRLGLHSDASYRFERGVDPEGQGRAADRAARLLAEIAGGTVSRGRVEAIGSAPPFTPEIPLVPERVNRLLGTTLSTDEIVDLLARVDVEARPTGEGFLDCIPPRYRSDLHHATDLVEEVARIHGYDAIPATLPGGAIQGVTEPPRRATTLAVRDALVGAGLAEMMSFPCVAPADADALGLAADDARRRAVRVLNPIHADRPVLRTELLGSLLRTARGNLARQVEGLAIFEVSRVFRAGEPGGLPEEPIEAALVLTDPPASNLWHDTAAPAFFRAKGAVERMLRSVGRPGTFHAGEVEPFLHPGSSGAFRVGGRTVAVVGDLHPAVASAFEIEASTAVAVVDVDALDGVDAAPPQYREVSRHPRVQRDLAVLLGADVAAGEVLEAIRKKAGGSLQDVVIFDRYEGKGVPEGRVSLAFRLTFQRNDRTLTEPEVTKATERVVQLLAKQFGGELR
jgi:phenylalanyl-tRNA synthetase beta chain